MTLQVQILKDKFNRSLGLPFKELLPESAIKLAISEVKIKYKKRLFDPFITLWAFLSQVLDSDKTCHNAVSKIIAHLAEAEVEIPSSDTSAYCQARARLPENLLEKLFNYSAQKLEEKITQEYLWCGRNILVIDGSTVSMPDTVENQKEYPLTVHSKRWMWLSNSQNWCDIQFSYGSRRCFVHRCIEHS